MLEAAGYKRLGQRAEPLAHLRKAPNAGTQRGLGLLIPGCAGKTVQEIPLRFQEEGREKGLPVFKVTIDCADCYTGPCGDFANLSVEALLGEHFAGGGQDPLSV